MSSARTELPKSSARHVRRERVLGLPVDAVSMDAAIDVAKDAIAERRLCRILVTNANKSFLARRDARLRAALEGADLVIPEWAAYWAARRLRRDGVHHIGGIRLMVRLLREAEAREWSAYLLGARADVVEALARKLAETHPRLRIAGYHHGYLDAQSDASVRSEITRLRPDLLFVGMGSPRQEYWLERIESGPCVALGVGGSFDVLSGVKRDAPVWMQGRGLEWLFRLSQDPRLWRRYLVTNPWFVWQVIRERMRGSAAL